VKGAGTGGGGRQRRTTIWRIREITLEDAVGGVGTEQPAGQGRRNQKKGEHGKMRSGGQGGWEGGGKRAASYLIVRPDAGRVGRELGMR